MSLFVLGLLACATHSLPMPGPLGPVARVRPPPVHVRDLPREPGAVTKKGRNAADARNAAKAPKQKRASHDDFGDQIAAAARRHLDDYPEEARNDCSGFVSAAHEAAGHPLSGSSRTLWEYAEEHDLTVRTPRPGDVAFFDNTYDRNRNRKRDDLLTHVAVVLDVESDGTILLAHAGTSKGRTTMYMNLGSPGEHTIDGKMANDWLRGRRKGESENALYLSGELFRGFARFRPDGA